jgi:hypothetical protein
MSNISKIVIGDEQDFIEFLKEKLSIDLDLDSISDLESNIGNKINIKVIVPETNRKYISVDQISDALEFASKKPNLSKKSYIFVYPAEKLNIESQNKLLKLLEEPPNFLEIFLMTNKSDPRLLQTISSRCEIINLGSNISLIDEEVSKELSKIFKLLISYNEANKVKGYKQLHQLIKNQSSNQSKLEVLDHFKDKVNAYAETKVRNGKIDNSDVKNLQKLLDLTNLISRGVQANVNSKLMIDKIFLEFTSIV